jgi:hypothetical protein
VNRAAGVGRLGRAATAERHRLGMASLERLEEVFAKRSSVFFFLWRFL